MAFMVKKQIIKIVLHQHSSIAVLKPPEKIMRQKPTTNRGVNNCAQFSEVNCTVLLKRVVIRQSDYINRVILFLKTGRHNAAWCVTKLCAVVKIVIAV